MRVLSFLFIIIIYSCSGQYKKTPVEKIVTIQQTKTQKGISIRKIGELRFRMSYVVEGKTLNLNQLKKIGEDGRTYYYAGKPDTVLLKKFQELGLVNNKSELLLKKFKSIKNIDFDHLNVEFQINDPYLEKLSCKLIRKDSTAYYNLIISDSMIKTQIQVDGFYMADLKFMLLDVMPGGYKEVVILNDYYIMNGDNSDLFIYEINYN